MKMNGSKFDYYEIMLFSRMFIKCDLIETGRTDSISVTHRPIQDEDGGNHPYDFYFTHFIIAYMLLF